MISSKLPFWGNTLDFFFNNCFGSVSSVIAWLLTSPWTSTWKQSSPTCSQLHPAADLVHGSGAAEEEQREAGDAGDDQRHGHADEEGGGFERSGGDAAELREASLTGEVPGQSVPDAVVEQTKVARLRRVCAVPDPVRLDEAHHVDDGEEDGEYRPEDADGPGITHVVGLVDLGSLRGGKHGGGRAGGPGDHPPVYVR